MSTKAAVQTLEEIPEELSVFLKSAFGTFLRNTEGVWLAGGALRRIYSGEPYYLEEHDLQTDFDIFFGSWAAYEKAKKFCDNHCRLTTEHKWVLTYHDRLGQKIQLIRKQVFAKPYDVIDQFDFTVCQIIFTGTEILTYCEAVEDMRDRVLKPVRIDNVYTVLRHMVRYGLYGYDLTPEMATAFVQACQREPNDAEQETLGNMGQPY